MITFIYPAANVYQHILEEEVASTSSKTLRVLFPKGSPFGIHKLRTSASSQNFHLNFFFQHMYNG